MIIGKEGIALKFVSMASSAELGKIFHTKVHLYLYVKVRKNSDDDKLIEL